MDYYLENESMGMLEKNKALFASIGSTFQNPMVDPSEEHEHQIDTFKMYSSFDMWFRECLLSTTFKSYSFIISASACRSCS